MASLQEQGWRSTTTDGREALYSPACPVSQAIEQRALLEQVRALRSEVDNLRVEVGELAGLLKQLLQASEAGRGVV